LTLSLLLVFATFVVERTEQRLLARVEDFGVRRLLPLFPPEEAGGTVGRELLEAERRASELLFQRVEQLVERQTAWWAELLEQARERWVKAADSQAEAFQEGLVRTLNGELKLLAEAVREVGSQTVAQSAEALGVLQESVERWQRSLDGHGEQLVSLQQKVVEQTQQLASLGSQAEQLSRLQAVLNENLQAVRAAELLEQTLHSLSAAVHLLTARSQLLTEPAANSSQQHSDLQNKAA